MQPQAGYALRRSRFVYVRRLGTRFLLLKEHEFDNKVVALKLGAAGVIGSDSKRREKLAGHAVDCVDATGAGDCFAGALLARMAAGDDFWEGLRYANAAAALATTGFGAVAPLPRPDAVRRLLSGFASPCR